MLTMITLGKSYTYQELLRYTKAIHQQYSTITEFRIAGRSYDDRDIPILRIGTGRQTLFCTGAVHGRESINPAVLLKMAEEYCCAFLHKETLAGYHVTELFSRYSICLIPVLNPDGYETATAGFEALRNPALRHQAKLTEIPWPEWKLNGRGIDINRNFPSRSYQPVNRSDYPGSETETRMLMKLFHAYPSIAYLDFHSRGNVIYFYRNALPDAYNRQQEKIATRLRAVSGYELGTREEEMFTTASGGNTVQYYSEKYGMPAITIETIPDEAEFPLAVSWQQTVYDSIHLLPLEMLSLAKSIRRYERKNWQMQNRFDTL